MAWKKGGSLSTEGVTDHLTMTTERQKHLLPLTEDVCMLAHVGEKERAARGRGKGKKGNRH